MEKSIRRYWPFFVAPTMAAFLIGFVWPFIWGLYLSLCQFQTLKKVKFVRFNNYLMIFKDPTFVHAFLFTALFTVVSTLTINVLAFVIATVMDRFRLLDQALSPILVITQTIPTIAIAPLLVLWMGFGMAPKITLVGITTFFPIAVGLLEGYRSVDPDAISLMRAMGASRVQIFYHVKFPAALPYFFSGLRISASYAIVGAVISEWLGGFEGLGVYMTRVKKAYAFDRMFAVIILIVIISLLLMALVDVIRRISMPWQTVREKRK